MLTINVLDSDEDQAAGGTSKNEEVMTNETSTNPPKISNTASGGSENAIAGNRPVNPVMAGKSKSVDAAMSNPKRNKMLTELANDATSKFLENFDPGMRERKKLRGKSAGPKPTAIIKPLSKYDENGVLRATGLDVCDCLILNCPGCHFPCPACGSPKCGPECRVNRNWAYDLIEFDGKDEVILNRLLKN